MVRFYEGGRWYSVSTDGGRELSRRRFGAGSDHALTAIDLQTPGDSLRFDPRGLADLSGVGSTLGRARFSAGTVVYEVAFNSLGMAKVGEL